MIIYPFLMPEDSGSGSAEDILDDVAPDTGEVSDDTGEETEEVEEIEEAEEKDEDDAEETDQGDDEESTEAEEKADEEPVTVSSSPIREATKKYPKVFKEFPELRESYFRDRDFRQIFPTVEDARVAYDATEQYTFIQNEVAQGNPTSLVEFLGRDTKTLARFGRAFLKQSMTTNPEAFEHITKPVLMGVLTNAMREAQLHGNKNLAASVKWISQYALGSPDVPADTFQDEAPRQNGMNPVIMGQIKEFTDEVYEQGQVLSIQMLADSIANLNVNKAVKKTLIREMFRAADAKIAEDAPHMRMMDSLWNKVRRGAVNRQNRATIISAYVGAFKKLLPSVRAQVLKDNGLSLKKGKREAIKTTDRESRSSTSPAGTRPPSARDKFRGKTDEQILDMYLK